ncbi:MAG: fibronectin type III domain-containing protein [Nocardioidaceae bacterium]|nr:fibronectin type III domain-containing protein [Nocardioidaceae bacterium]
MDDADGMHAHVRRALVAVAVASVLVLGQPVAQADAAPKRPGKVATVKAVVKGTTTVAVRWTRVKGATGYKVELATDRTMTTLRRAVNTKSRAATVTGLRQGTGYYVRVRAYKGRTAGAPSRLVTTRTLYATPTAPRVRSAATGTTSARVTWTRSTYATAYRVVVTRGAGTSRVVRRTAWAPGRAVSLGALPVLPAGGFYYARVEASNSGKASRVSTATPVLLTPYAPTSPAVGATSPSGGTVTWTRASNAQRYELQAATGPDFAGARTATTNTLGEGIAAVNGLRPSTLYHFRVRSVTGTMRSAWVPAGTGTTRAAGYALQVGSFNVHCADPAARCSTTRPWSQRRGTVAGVINRTDFDVIGVQEAATPDVGNGRSQGVDLASLLAGRYAYADGAAHRAGRWLYYDRTSVQPVGKGGNLRIGFSSGTRKEAFAVWQVFTKTGTGRQFMVVNAHTDPYVGREYDDNRRSQVDSLTTQVRGLAAVRAGVPVIYVGDFNSHEFRTFDGPRSAFNEIGYLDSDDFAARKIRADFNSANGWRDPNPRAGAHTDHVYVPRTVGVREFEVDLNTDGAGRWLGRIPSDHNAVRALLEMPAS